MPNQTPTLDDVPASEVADKFMKNAFEFLTREQKKNPSRANSTAITYLETAMMWNNKDRTIKGEVKPYPTHIAAEELTDLPK